MACKSLQTVLITKSTDWLSAMAPVSALKCVSTHFKYVISYPGQENFRCVSCTSYV